MQFHPVFSVAVTEYKLSIEKFRNFSSMLNCIICKEYSTKYKKGEFPVTKQEVSIKTFPTQYVKINLQI